MKDPRDSISPLYQGARRLRYILPITAFFLVLIHQSLTHIWLSSSTWFPHFLGQVLLYGTVGPIVVWFALNWFARWVRERDEAEEHLRCLYQISRQAASATEMEALTEITLEMPEQIINPVATSLILRDHPDGGWTLAGTRGLRAGGVEMLASRLSSDGNELYCGQCADLSASAHQNCPMQFPLAQVDAVPTSTAVICLPLSTERPPLALLNVHVFDEESISPGTRRVLESMAAVLSVALDHARLRAREFQMLHRMEQVVRQREDLAATLEHILIDIATVHRAQAGEIFLVTREAEEPNLVPIASWPEEATRPQLVSAARRALLEEDTIEIVSSRGREHLAAIPLMAEGVSAGVLALIRPNPFTISQRAFLGVAASTIALIIRNSQLYAKLESQAVMEERNRLAREVHDGLAQSVGFLNFKIQQIDRLLGREQWEAARQALQEMRETTQEVYAEVRLTIQDLRWLPEDGGGLRDHLQQYVQDFSERTGLDVSLVLENEPNLSPQDKVHVFRIAQEALTNAHKHAHAQQVWVRLGAGPQGTVLEIEDDGCGIDRRADSQNSFSSEPPGHYGLRIMQERAEAIGGQLSLSSTPRQGTRLRVTVGVPPDTDPQPTAKVAEGN